jgi:hypothetical protein
VNGRTGESCDVDMPPPPLGEKCTGAFNGFCGTNCDDESSCTRMNCSDNTCKKDCTCPYGCRSGSQYSYTWGQCSCVRFFASPGCNEECSGACSTSYNPYLDIDALGQTCRDTSRCTCTGRCLSINKIPNNYTEYKPASTLKDPGMPYASCRCHCANGMTGERCNVDIFDSCIGA